MAEEDIAEFIEQYIRDLFEIEQKSRARQTRDEILEYHKQYYIKHKDKIRCPCACCYCGTTFADKSGYTRHLKRNLKCKLRRAENRLAQLEASSSEENPRSSSSSSAPRDTPARDGRGFLN